MAVELTFWYLNEFESVSKIGIKERRRSTEKRRPY